MSYLNLWDFYFHPRSLVLSKIPAVFIPLVESTSAKLDPLSTGSFSQTTKKWSNARFFWRFLQGMFYTLFWLTHVICFINSVVTDSTSWHNYRKIWLESKWWTLYLNIYEYPYFEGSYPVLWNRPAWGCFALLVVCSDGTFGRWDKSWTLCKIVHLDSVLLTVQ